jgi:hypothetical protein
MGPKTLPTIWYTYMKLVNKYILDGRKDRGKTVYPPPLPGSGIIKIQTCNIINQQYYSQEKTMMFVIFRYNVLLLSGLCNVLLLINFSDMSFRLIEYFCQAFMHHLQPCCIVQIIDQDGCSIVD